MNPDYNLVDFIYKGRPVPSAPIVGGHANQAYNSSAEGQGFENQGGPVTSYDPDMQPIGGLEVVSNIIIPSPQNMYKGSVWFLSLYN